jgi:hypothetical protein
VKGVVADDSVIGGAGADGGIIGGEDGGGADGRGADGGIIGGKDSEGADGGGADGNIIGGADGGIVGVIRVCWGDCGGVIDAEFGKVDERLWEKVFGWGG